MTSFQPMPPLSDDEYAALKDDIRVHGQQVPILIDEDGNIIDGHNRERICIELGIKVRFEVLQGLDEQAKWDTALRLNNNRRHLSLAQRQEMVRAELQRDPSRTDRQIASVLGVDHKTVARHRHLLFDAPDPVIPDPRDFRVYASVRGTMEMLTEDYPMEDLNGDEGWTVQRYEDYLVWSSERLLAYYQSLSEAQLGAAEFIVTNVIVKRWALEALEMLDWDARPRAAVLHARLSKLCGAAFEACEARWASMDKTDFDAEQKEHEVEWGNEESGGARWNEWNFRVYFLQVLREGPGRDEAA